MAICKDFSQGVRLQVFACNIFATYQLSNFDRYGTQVFYSKDPALCWDGTSRGKDCPEGIFVYSLIFQNGECAETVLKGDLSLLR